MTHEAPRQSVLFGLRESNHGARHYNSVRLNTEHGAFAVPAYSQDSDVLGCSSSSGIFCRRVPSAPFNNGTANAHDGKEMASLSLAGGAAWYPTGNKFYHGATQIDANDSGLFCVIDPETDVPRRVYVAGKDGKTCGRAFWHPANNEIWLQSVFASTAFVRVDPTDDSIVGYVAGSPSNDFTYRSTDDCIFYTTIGGGSVVKVASDGTATTVFNQAAWEAHLGNTVSVFFVSIGIEYIDSAALIYFTVKWSNSATPLDYNRIVTTLDATETIGFVGLTSSGGFVNGGQEVFKVYYTPQFDKIIYQEDFGVLLVSVNTDFSSPVVLGSILGGGASDNLTARGCYCDNVNAIALPVLTGPPGGRFFDVNYYGSADL